MKITYTITVEIANPLIWRAHADLVAKDRAEENFEHLEPMDPALTGDMRRADAFLAIPKAMVLPEHGLASVSRVIVVDPT